MTRPPSDGRSVLLTARLVTAPLDARRGIVRLHRETLTELGLAPWDAVQLTGRRSTGALVAVTLDDSARDELRCDDLGLGNLGLRDGAAVTVQPVPLLPAAAVVVAGPADVLNALPSDMLRRALVGKVLTEGDDVSLLPQDVAPTGAADVASVRRALANALGMVWTTALLTVVSTTPAGPRLVTAETAVNGRTGAAGQRAVVRTRLRPTGGAPPLAVPPEADMPLPSLDDLAWLAAQADRLREWLDLSFHHGPLLARLGSEARLGVLVTGAEGSGRSTLARVVAAAVGAATVRRSPADLVGLAAGAAADALREALDEAAASVPAVLLVEDVETLAPTPTGTPGMPPAPLAAAVRDVVARAVATPGVALVCTATSADAVDPDLRRPGLLDREVAVPLPDRAQRRALLEVLLRAVPRAADVALDEVAARTPGFVAADLLAVRREAAVRAALRQREEPQPTVGQGDLLGALDVVRASTAESTVDVPSMSLDDVGDMAETKQALTETVLWPLAHAASFARLGVDPPRGVLLYGPPGCGKTFLVRALAGTGQVNVVVVKGAELLSMWVGESERGVRELFRRARESAPTLVFLDEIDALAPARGRTGDSGVSDRVVAALLTELDGVESLRDVVVVGATNRPDLIDPALLRPGRLERLVYVPPPDGAARGAILRTAARNTPLAADVDLDALGRDTDGFSAADCAALVREAALAAMRRSLDALEVTAWDVAAARRAVRPSLDPAQVATLAAYATRHRPQ